MKLIWIAVYFFLVLSAKADVRIASVFLLKSCAWVGERRNTFVFGGFQSFSKQTLRRVWEWGVHRLSARGFLSLKALILPLDKSSASGFSFPRR